MTPVCLSTCRFSQFYWQCWSHSWDYIDITVRRQFGFSTQLSILWSTWRSRRWLVTTTVSDSMNEYILVLWACLYLTSNKNIPPRLPSLLYMWIHTQQCQIIIYLHVETSSVWMVHGWLVNNCICSWTSVNRIQWNTH